MKFRQRIARWLIVPSFLPFFFSYGQEDSFNEPWRWTQFTTESGLPSNHVDGIYEAADGIPWALTSAGLAWYDGFRWNAINDSLGILRKHLDWIVPAMDHGLLVITNNLLFKVTIDRIEQIPLFVGTQELRPYAIAPVNDHALMVFADTSIFMVRNNALYPMKLPSRTYFDAMPIIYSNRNIWINCYGGIYRWNRTEWDLKMKPAGEPYGEDLKLVEGMQGKSFVWIKSPLKLRGLWELSNDRSPMYNKREGKEAIKTMDISSTGEVIAIYESGGIRMKKESGWSTLQSVPNQLRNVLFVKYRSNGDLWVGSESGLHLLKRSSHRWSYWNHPFPNFKNTIHTMLETRDGLIWLGTGQGVEVRRRDGSVVRKIDTVDGEEISIVTGLGEDQNGCVWISSGSQISGAYRWDGVRWKHFGEREGLRAPRVHKIVADRKGRLWFLGMGATGDGPQPGAFMYENGKFSQPDGVQDLPNKRVYSFVQSQDSSLWFGTLKGLYRWKNGIWTSCRELAGRRIFALAADSSGRIWFGENAIDPKGSFGYVDESDSVHFLSMNDQHINTEVFDLAFDPAGTLWITTHGGDGILRYHKGMWSSFNLSTGLNDLRLWPILIDRDRLYVGTDGNGVDILSFEETQNPPPQVEVSTSSIEGDNVFIRWNVLTYWGEIPSREAFSRYRLDDGLWTDWTADHEIKLSHIASGKHEAIIQSKSLFGYYDSLGHHVAFTIAPPLYLRPAIVLPIAVLSVGVTFLGVMLFVRKRKHDAAIREREAKLHTVTETTSSAIFIFRNFLVCFSNSSAEVLTGFKKRELLGISFLDIIHPEHRAIVQERAGLGHDNHLRQFHGELKILTKEKKERWIDLTAGEIELDGLPATLGTAVDITERKLAEERLLSYQEKLQSLASELTLTEERERRRMASFLHDSIGQALAMCRFKLGSQDKMISREMLNDVRKYVDQASQNTQSLTFDLSPPILYELSFEDAIEWLTEQTGNEHHLPVYFYVDKKPKEISQDIRIFLYNAIRELLINVVKHAHAHSAKVSIRGEGEMTLICVQDDGGGFEASIPNNHKVKDAGHFGLFNIRERLTHLGGRLEIESQIHVGTKVIISIPSEKLNSGNTRDTI